MSSSRPLPVRVRVTDGKGFEKIALLKADILRIGRDPANDLQLDHPTVAAYHLVIYREGERYLLVDTSPGKATLRNGAAAATCELSHGDDISLSPDCPYRLTFFIEGTRRADLQERWLRALLRASRAIHSSLDLDTILHRMMDAAMEITEADRGGVVLLETDGSLTPRVARNVGVDRLLPGDDPAPRRLVEEAIRTRRPAVARSRSGDAEDEAGIALAAPIRMREKIAGVIFVAHEHPCGHVPGDDLDILESIAEQAGAAIENALLTERMLLAERLSTVGRVISSILEEFKGPLACIRHSAQQLRAGRREPGEERLTRRILDAAERISDMAAEVRHFCRGRAGLNLTRRGLAGFLSRTMDRVQEEMASRRVSLVLDVRADAVVPIDARRMERALLNLFDNAADAMPGGGVLTLRTQNVDGRMVISIADTGVGMPEEVRRRLFEPFFTHGKARGAGLGMAITRGIVEEHGWTIEVDSVPECGTMVRLLLPDAFCTAEAEEAGAVAGIAMAS